MAKDYTVEQNDQTWDVSCLRCGFASTGHETKSGAVTRIREHLAEHEES